jgi:hypothetical protein
VREVRECIAARSAIGALRSNFNDKLESKVSPHNDIEPPRKKTCQWNVLCQERPYLNSQKIDRCRNVRVLAAALQFAECGWGIAPGTPLQ